MATVNICPKCKNYIFGDVCFGCNINVIEYAKNQNISDLFKDIFGQDFCKDK